MKIELAETSIDEKGLRFNWIDGWIIGLVQFSTDDVVLESDLFFTYK